MEPLGGLIKSDFWAPCLEFLIQQLWDQGFFGGSVVKNPPAFAGDVDLILGLGRSPGGGNGNPLQYSCLENYVDRGAWWAVVHGGHKESDKTERLNTHSRR